MKYDTVEILAPAGSYESLVAAVNAGADAVYMGGSRFGARAYADNPQEDKWLEAIDYAHLHGCSLYMTVNTLAKEAELAELEAYLTPYYQHGLDAVIVQDMGVFTWIRERFPDLPVHASTQMTITGYHGAKLLKELGAARVVTARELSLEEISRIHAEVDIEIESFVHGALCYCYSGQCLLSSFIGGRSGNRGRCAQPCRLPYEVRKDGRKINRKDERYLLSPKDLCTLDLIPELIEAGIYSLKIEGRMKSPRYTAGVVSIYRKYVNLYLERGRSGYHVDPADRASLLDLFDRGGFTDGYYQQHNGPEMIAGTEKPAFRAANQTLFDYLDQTYVNQVRQKPVSGALTVCEGQVAVLSLWCERGGTPGQVISATVTGDIVQTAANQPLSEERIEKQIRKTGNSPFFFEHLEILAEGSCFLPMQSLNELRRAGMEAMARAITEPYRRERCPSGPAVALSVAEQKPCDIRIPVSIHVSLERPDTLTAALAAPAISEIYIDATGFPAACWAKTVSDCHHAGKKCLLVMPHIFRQEAERYFNRHLATLKESGFDGVVIRSLEEVGYLAQSGFWPAMVFDYNMYGMNRAAGRYYQSVGAVRQTLPVELNSRELEQLGGSGKELIVYGYLPVMVSAQCILKNTEGCQHQPQLLYLKDRKGKELPVRNHCIFCYNTVYNTSPVSLLGLEDKVRRLNPEALRLQFTIETPEEVEVLIQAYADSFGAGRTVVQPSRDYTRGHFNRGIE